MSDETPNVGRVSRRRRHKAAGARVAASGLGAGALLGIVGALGAHASPAATTKAATAPRAMPAAPRAMPAAIARRRVELTTTPTTIVWRTVHRVIVVTDPPESRVSSSGGGLQRSYAPAHAPSAAAVGRPAPPPPVAARQPTPAPAPQAAPAPAPPSCSGSKCP